MSKKTSSQKAEKAGKNAKAAKPAKASKAATIISTAPHADGAPGIDIAAIEARLAQFDRADGNRRRGLAARRHTVPQYAGRHARQYQEAVPRRQVKRRTARDRCLFRIDGDCHGRRRQRDAARLILGDGRQGEGRQEKGDKQRASHGGGLRVRGQDRPDERTGQARRCDLPHRPLSVEALARWIGHDDLIAPNHVQQGPGPFIELVAIDAVATQAGDAAFHRVAITFRAGEFRSRGGDVGQALFTRDQSAVAMHRMPGKIARQSHEQTWHGDGLKKAPKEPQRKHLTFGDRRILSTTANRCHAVRPRNHRGAHIFHRRRDK